MLSSSSSVCRWVLAAVEGGLLTKRGCRCQDKNGTFTVETTAWEGTEAAKTSTGAAGGHAMAGVGVGQLVQKLEKPLQS